MARGPHNCRAVLQSVLEELNLPEVEIDRLLERQQELADYYVADQGLDFMTALQFAAQRLTQEGQVNRAVARRNAALTVRAVQSMRQFVFNWVGRGGRAKDAMKAVFSEFARDFRGSTRSLENIARAQLKHDMGMVRGGMDREGVLAQFDSGSHDTLVLRELSGIDTGDSVAKSIARVMNEVRTHQTAAINQRGGWIQHLKDFVAQHDHNPNRIRDLGRRADGTYDQEAGFQRWAREISPRMDWRRSFGGVPTPERQLEILKEIHADIVTRVDGRRAQEVLNLRDAIDNPESLNRYQVAQSLAASASQSRTIHFKDAEAWWQYHQLFGTERGLRSIFLSEVENRSKMISTMSVLGPNPDNTLRHLIEQLRAEARNMSTQGDAGFDAAAFIDDLNPNKITNVWYNDYVRLTGWQRQYGLEKAQFVVDTIKRVNAIAKLGGVAITSLLDRVNLYRGLIDRGMSGLDSFSRAFWLQAKNLSPEEHRMMGNMLESWRGKTIDRWTDTAGGSANESRILHWFMTLNGMNALNDNSKSVVAEGLMSIYGRHANTVFGELPDVVARDLNAAGISPQDWQIIRQTATRDFNGDRLLVAHDILSRESLSDGVLMQVLPPRASRRSLNELRQRLFITYSALIQNQIDKVVVTPGIDTQRWTSLFLQRGHPMQMVASLLTMFKSFPIAYAQKFLNRPLHHAPVSVGSIGQRAAYLARSFIGNPLVPLSHAAMLFGMSYVIMNIKSVLKGQGFIDPTQQGDPDKIGKLAIDLMAQSGALGIIGDATFQAYDNGRNSLLNRLAGPVFGDLVGPVATATTGTATQLYKSATGQETNWGKLGNDYLRIIRSHTPGANLPVVGAVMENLFWNILADMFQPGIVEERRRRREREGLVKVGPKLEQ